VLFVSKPVHQIIRRKNCVLAGFFKWVDGMQGGGRAPPDFKGGHTTHTLHSLKCMYTFGKVVLWLSCCLIKLLYTPVEREKRRGVVRHLSQKHLVSFCGRCSIGLQKRYHICKGHLKLSR
jgi:hypothetical protein